MGGDKKGMACEERTCRWNEKEKYDSIVGIGKPKG